MASSGWLFKSHLNSLNTIRSGENTISVEGGQEPVWAPSGSELYYRHDHEFVVVSVDETGSSLSVGTPRHVLDDRFMLDTGGAQGGVANYDMRAAPGGRWPLDGRGVHRVALGPQLDRGASPADGGLMTTDPITRLNSALEGRYRVERELGEGGMATVYLAEDLRHEREVALKVLKPELAAVVGVERFLAEIKTTANLQHPHILPLHDSGEAVGFLYFVMPHIEGDTLRDKIDREKQLSVEEALKIAEKVASALEHAHKHGVVHRDIKPILLNPEGEPTVADFGIAWL